MKNKPGLKATIKLFFMIKALFTILLNPLIVAAQDPKPAYKNDTLYTTCGYKIYKGQALHFAKGTGKKEQFKYVTIKNHVAPASIANNSVVVKELKNIQISPMDEGYVDIMGAIIFKDGSTGAVELHIMFDKAIENVAHLPSEIIVPVEFRNSSRVLLHQQLNKLFKLFVPGAISKTAYEAQKKKLFAE